MPFSQEVAEGKSKHPAPKAGSVVWVCPSYTLVYPKVAGGKSIAACEQNPPMKQLYGAAAGVQVLVPASHVPPAWVQARADKTKARFYSLSSGNEAEISEYYSQLKSAQRGTFDITEWLMWFLACLDCTIDGANEKLTSVLRKARAWGRINQSPVNARQRKVINRMLDNFTGHLTTAKYAKLE